MIRFYPVVPLAHHQALGIAIMSYDGRLAFGLLGDYDAMGDLEALADDLRAAIDDLSRAAGLPERAAAARASAPRAIASALQRALSSRRRAAWAAAYREGHARRARPDQRHRRRHRRQRGQGARAARARARGRARSSRSSPSWRVTGYPPEDLLLKEHFLADARAAVERIAADAQGIVAVVGFPERADDVYNAAAVLADGARAGHLPQGQPAQLRGLRRAALLPARARAGRSSRSTASRSA